MVTFIKNMTCNKTILKIQLPCVSCIELLRNVGGISPRVSAFYSINARQLNETRHLQQQIMVAVSGIMRHLKKETKTQYKALKKVFLSISMLVCAGVGSKFSN